MSELTRPTPEAEKSRGTTRDPDFTSGPPTPAEILSSLGADFGVCWDVLQELTKDNTFNVEAFVETITKLHPEYLEHIKRGLEEDMMKLPELMAKPAAALTSYGEAKKEYLAEFAKKYIERIEFYSRLKPPEKVPTGGKTVEQLEYELRQANVNVSDYAREMMHKTKTKDKYGTFTTSKEAKTIDFVRLKVKDLFRDKKNHSFEEIIAKA